MVSLMNTCNSHGSFKIGLILAEFSFSSDDFIACHAFVI